MAFQWRRWNRALHRDIGYASAGLTVIYALSGIVVNHTHEINPNYSVEREERSFDPVPVGERDVMVAALVERLELPGPPKESFRSTPEQVELFYEGFSVKARAVEGRAVIERSKPRFLIKDMNMLHLNRLRGWWTWVADLYAALLLFLAVSGVILLKGGQGLGGRGKWFVLAGVAVPVLFLWIQG